MGKGNHRKQETRQVKDNIPDWFHQLRRVLNSDARFWPLYEPVKKVAILYSRATGKEVAEYYGTNRALWANKKRFSRIAFDNIPSVLSTLLDTPSL